MEMNPVWRTRAPRSARVFNAGFVLFTRARFTLAGAKMLQRCFAQFQRKGSAPALFTSCHAAVVCAKGRFSDACMFTPVTDEEDYPMLLQVNAVAAMFASKTRSNGFAVKRVAPPPVNVAKRAGQKQPWLRQRRKGKAGSFAAAAARAALGSMPVRAKGAVVSRWRARYGRCNACVCVAYAWCGVRSHAAQRLFPSIAQSRPPRVAREGGVFA